MAVKALPAFLLIFGAFTILTMIYISQSGDATIPTVQYRPPNPQIAPRAFQCLEVVPHLWHKEVPYGVPGLLINPEKRSDLLTGNTTSIVNRLYTTMCPHMLSLPNVEFVFSDILLIVDFVSPKHYGVIPYIELLYRRYFPNILYCGLDPEAIKKLMVTAKIGFPVYYVHALKGTWQVKYECIEHAMKTCDNFTGYLLIGDDTLINMKMFQATPKDMVIVGSDLKRGGVNTTQFHIDWMWWELEGGRSAVLGVLNELSFRAYHEKDTIAQDFLQKYYSFVNSSTIVHFMCIDFLYIPRRLCPIFLYMTSLFQKYKFNVEMAIAYLVCGLKGDVHFVKMHSLWGSDRENPEKFYENDVVYVHPFKYGENFKKAPGYTCFMKNKRISRKESELVARNGFLDTIKIVEHLKFGYRIPVNLQENYRFVCHSVPENAPSSH